MTTAPWDRIRTLFYAALDLPEPERETFLAEVCAGDRQLLAEVASLLAADAGEGVIGSSPSAGSPDGEPLPAVEILPRTTGSRVGPYRLGKVLGRGGMGIVFEATRADGHFTKTVAVKLVDRLSVGTEERNRFLFERQVLAGLEHPNIATLLDGGVTEDGLQFLVMERVCGRPITEHCDARRLSIRRRIDLFLTVCDAVQHAHQASVLHRDLKPSNILVTDEGQPKLLDFGVAKLLDPTAMRSLPDELATVAWAMTPKYASPEQLRGQGPLTTASDVYSLTVLLYQLLTGSLPYPTDPADPAQQDDPAELRERILSGTIVRPGHRQPTAEAAENRATHPAALRRALSGDLERIVLAGLRLDPAERYATVGALASDLRRYLDGFPVAAREPTLLYRGRKFFRRHTLGVAAITAFIALLAAAAVVSTLQAHRVAAERDRAEATRKLLVEAFEQADPWQTRGENVTAREILDRGAERIGRELADQPRLRAELLTTLGDIYENLGLPARSLALHDEALAIRRKLWHGPHTEVVDSLEASALSLRELGRYKEAEARLREAVTISESFLDRLDPMAIGARLDLGEVLRHEGRLDEAEKVLRQGLADARKATGDRAATVADAANLLGNLLDSRGRYAEAEPLFREVLALHTRNLPEDHPLVAQALQNLGETLRGEAKYPEAERHLREALAMRLRLFGEDHPAVATTLNNLGITLYQEGELEQAAEDLERALAIRRRAHPDGDPTMAMILGNLAAIDHRLGRLSEAEKDTREALEVQQRTLGPDHPDTARSLQNLAAILRDEGRPQEAVPLFERALAIRRRKLGSRSPAVASTLDNYATTLLLLGRSGQAEPLYREALAIRRESLGDDHPDTARSELDLGILLTQTDRPDLAEPLLRQAASTFETVLGADHRDTAVARTYLAAAALGLGQVERARRLLAGSRSVVEAELPPENRDRKVFEATVRRLAQAR